MMLLNETEEEKRGAAYEVIFSNVGVGVGAGGDGAARDIVT